MRKKVFIGAGTGVFLIGLFLYGMTEGWTGSLMGPGRITEKRIPATLIQARKNSQQKAAREQGVSEPKQILFGDLHVHTSISTDAYIGSLPMMQGEGLHPLSDACDFARYCSSLDFWSINDHAGSVTPKHWKDTIDSVRQCNALADPDLPDVTVFLGYEWTQVGTKPDNHYGHKNVIFKDLKSVPDGPIMALNPGLGVRHINAPLRTRLGLPLINPANFSRYLDYNKYSRNLVANGPCDDADSSDVPGKNCIAGAVTPAELFAKLDKTGLDYMVIPHGNTWGLYTPAGVSWDKQLKNKNHVDKKQPLIEVHSGHGNSEEYRSWRGVRFDAQGKPVCPPATSEYLPGCRQAGVIIYKRCKTEGAPDTECEKRKEKAIADYFASGIFGFASVPGAKLEDWLDARQCRDCFLPAFSMRPGGSVQYALAIRNFDKQGDAERFHFGFIASSDNHTARPGTGYKEKFRRPFTEATGAASSKWHKLISGEPEKPIAHSRVIGASNPQKYGAVLFERLSSYFVTGGLVAVHSRGRKRDAIWDAMQKKEVYGTSGDRILLWFDLLNGPGKENPMGSLVKMTSTPRFRVRAVGAFKQKAGCPDFSLNALSPRKMKRLCKNECYNPSGRRKLITRIEVIRIRPQVRPDEKIKGLVQDVWKVLKCPARPSGCTVEFSDPEFTAGKRDTVYYVRAIEEKSLAVNGGGYRCTYDDKGNCVRINACRANYKGKYTDDCLSEIEERAWSSPIFVDAGWK